MDISGALPGTSGWVAVDPLLTVAVARLLRAPAVPPGSSPPVSERATDLLTRAEAAYRAAVADPASARAASDDVVAAARDAGQVEA